MKGIIEQRCTETEAQDEDGVDIRQSSDARGVKGQTEARQTDSEILCV